MTDVTVTQEWSAEHYALAAAIADGFSGGNEQFADAEASQQGRYLMAADAVFARHRQSSTEEVERLREALTWYADQMCEGLCLGKDPQSCANIGADNCAGCPSVIALTGVKPHDD